MIGGGPIAGRVAQATLMTGLNLNLSLSVSA
jgi:hypothetical protein